MKNIQPHNSRDRAWFMCCSCQFGMFILLHAQEDRANVPARYQPFVSVGVDFTNVGELYFSGYKDLTIGPLSVDSLIVETKERASNHFWGHRPFSTFAVGVMGSDPSHNTAASGRRRTSFCPFRATEVKFYSLAYWKAFASIRIIDPTGGKMIFQERGTT